ncbi:MAG: DUF1080 domain-containing protein [Planctomycetota bacterium]
MSIHTFMKRSLYALAVSSLLTLPCLADESTILFDGKSTDQWEFRPGGWVIEDGALTCRMETVTQKNGQAKKRGMGYIWTKQEFANFELTLQYKLSESANSGVFFRTDPENPVQGGFEIQLLDDEGFQKAKGPKDGKNLNGAFYDSLAASAKPGKPIGSWNDFRLICNGPAIQVEINGVKVIDANVDDWDTAGQNPDGTKNKFKTALKDLPRTGRIGFQNHGQVVWFRNVKIQPK